MLYNYNIFKKFERRNLTETEDDESKKLTN
jgi:hypothetical protein